MTETVVTSSETNVPSLLNALLATKLYVPPPRPNLVPRTRLIARLNQSLAMGHKLILISAPPGSGKTSLLSEWIYHGDETATVQPNNVAWVSLDKEDNDPQRFLRYCIAALQNIRPQVGQPTLAALENWPSQRVSTQTLLTIAINEMAALQHKVLFVLDDFHLITNPVIYRGLGFILDNLPPQVHLVVAGRTQIPLPVANLRGRAELTELHGPDLRFTPPETSTFLNQTMGLNLSPQAAAVLESRTEGWIAGLQMAALSLQGRPAGDATAVAKAFTGSHRYIMDYLLEEVLQQQPDEVQQFLLQTAILDRLCTSLCAALLNKEAKTRGREDAKNLDRDDNDSQNLESKTIVLDSNTLVSKEMISTLERANLFIIPLDDERYWYRYHHLFADLLRHRLEQTVPAETITTLHRRASDWYQQNGLVTEAMRHALAAVDIERVVRLARQKAATMMSRSEMVTALSWLDALPQELVRSRPGVSLLYAWAMVLTGRLEAVEPYLQEAEQEFKTSPTSAGTSGPSQTNIQGEATALRAMVAYFQRDMPQAVALCQESLIHLPPDNLFLRGIVVQGLGAAHSWSGNVVEASRAFTEARAIGQTTGNMQVGLNAIWNLAQLGVEQGYLRNAAQLYRRGITLAETVNDAEKESILPVVGRLHVGLAGVLLEWNQLQAAGEHAAIGLELGRAAQEPGTLTSSYLVLVRLRQAQSDEPGTEEAIRQADQLSRRYSGPYYWATQTAVAQAGLWLAQGNFRTVADWVRNRKLQFDPLPQPIPYLREKEYLLLARLLLAQAGIPSTSDTLLVQKPLEMAGVLLAQIIASAGESKRMGPVLEALILQALVYYVQQNETQAQTALEEALSLAEPEDYQRLFIEAGPPLADLLRRPAIKKFAPNYVSNLLAAIGQTAMLAPSPAELLDPLSERELEILQLIANGMSNKELANELVLTVGTVKWHLNNIYSKLGVRSRTQAVARARELGLV